MLICALAFTSAFNLQPHRRNLELFVHLAPFKKMLDLLFTTTGFSSTRIIGMRKYESADDAVDERRLRGRVYGFVVDNTRGCHRKATLLSASSNG